MIEEHEEQLLEAFRSFTKLERVLRHMIGEVLSAHFGTQWNGQVPESMRKRIGERMQNASESDLGPEREKGLLEFADFSELVQIVRYFWDDTFHIWFPDEQITFGLFEQVRNYRNALMHSVLLPKHCPIFIGLCQEFIGQLESVSKKTFVTSSQKPTPVTSTVTTVQVSTTEDQKAFQQKISAILSEMTGLLEGERDALLGCIERNLGLCTQVLLAQVRHKFDNLPETDALIDTLASRLPPEKPRQPDPGWKSDATKWLKWAVGSYLPYRYWMMTNDQADGEIEAMSRAYEDWLYRSYTKLLRKYPQRFVSGSYLHISKLLKQNKIVLWILVDNLPFFCRPLLMKQLHEHGLKVIDVIKQIAMLPSETFVSRKSALAGRLPSQIPEKVSEVEALLEAWQSRTDKRIVVLEKPQDLENIHQYQAGLFIYVYTRLDSLWHTPAAKDFEREAEIEVGLARLVARLSTAMTQLEQRNPALLVISTDHGSIYLPRCSEELSVPYSAAKDITYEQHRRFIRTSQSDALNDVEWFYLDKDEFHLHHNYAVARGWRYIDSRPHGFTHGGLSPEETVVPMLVCELGEAEFERLQPIYEQATDPLRLGRPGKLAIRVSNPHRLPIEHLEIVLSDFGLTFPPTNVEPQMEVVTEAIDFQLPAKMKVDQDAVFVNLTAQFDVGGQSHSHMTKLRIKIRQLFKTELDDDFGAMFS
jgi:hypothetical protein